MFQKIRSSLQITTGISSVVLIFLGIIIYANSISSYNKGYLHKPSYLLDYSSPLFSAILFIKNNYNNLTDRYSAAVSFNADKKNIIDPHTKLLKSKILQLRAQNIRLKKLLRMSSSYKLSGVAASVIAGGISTYKDSVIIDAGKNEGLLVGMPVMNSVGVVGQLTMVGEKYSRLLLISDRLSGIDVIAGNQRKRAILSGIGEGHVVVKVPTATFGLNKNDLLVTSGLDGVFPKGLLVGKISDKIDIRFGMENYSVSIAAKLGSLEEVFVITSMLGTPASQVEREIKNLGLED